MIEEACVVCLRVACARRARPSIIYRVSCGDIRVASRQAPDRQRRYNHLRRPTHSSHSQGLEVEVAAYVSDGQQRAETQDDERRRTHRRRVTNATSSRGTRTQTSTPPAAPPLGARRHSHPNGAPGARRHHRGHIPRIGNYGDTNLPEP